MLMRKLLSLVLVCLVLCSCMTVRASAADSHESGWIELLESVSISDNGTNIFRMPDTYTLAIPTPKEMRIRKIDLLIRTPAPYPITSASCTVNTTTMELDVLRIGDNLVRIVGDIPDATYKTINIRLGRPGTTYQPFEVLSCKVTPLLVQEFVCDASVDFAGTTYPTGQHINILGDWPEHATYSDLVRIDIRDWQKYDSITIWGSTDGFAINTIRANLSTTGIPFTVSFIQPALGSEWSDFVHDGDITDKNDYSEYYGGEGIAHTTPLQGRYLFCITVDLTGLDRSLPDPMFVYLSGNYDGYAGFSFNCQYVNGRVVTADTAGLTWWHRFTAFMTDLFGGDEPAPDDFQDDAGEQHDELEDMNEQLESFTKPDIEDMEMEVSDIVDPGSAQGFTDALSSLTGNSLSLNMMTITLTIALVGYILYGKR